MKLKTKFMIAIAMIIFAICLFNANTVNAVEVTEEYVQNMLDVLPDKMEINLQEKDFKDYSRIIEENIRNIWKNKGIDSPKARIMINASEENTGITLAYDGFSFKYKNIKFIYNNQNKYNSNDEKYVKNIKIPIADYFEVSLDWWNKNYNDHEYKYVVENYIDVVEKYYTNLINDKSIVVKASISEGGLDPLSVMFSHRIGIFKNGVLYNIINARSEKHNGYAPTIITVDVPSTMNEKEISDYVINSIKLSDDKIVSIEKGAKLHKKVDIPNGYTVHFEEEYDDSLGVVNQIIVKRSKEETKNTITKTDNNTNIKLETTEGIVPSNTVLEVKPITEGKIFDKIKNIISNVNKFKIFDINLLSNGAKIQPNGKVKISIPIPEGFDTSKLIVYRIEDNGNKVEYNVTVKDNYATFETDHFSNYVLAELTETKAENTETKQGEKDNTPKTGIETNNIVAYTIGLIAIVGIGMLIISRKNS